MTSHSQRYFYNKGLEDEGLEDEGLKDTDETGLVSDAQNSQQMDSEWISVDILNDAPMFSESQPPSGEQGDALDSPMTAESGYANTHSHSEAYQGASSDGYKNNDAGTQVSRLPILFNALRFCGALFVVASMSLFLLQGWSEGNDVERYLKLLAQTVLLTAAGFGLAFIVKENRGARVFFGLSLISIVSNFAVLGALLYSFYQLDGHLQQYPSIVTWQASDWGSFAIIAIPAILALAGLAFTIMLMFARQHAKLLTIGLIGLSVLLLLPIRSLWVMLPLVAMAFLFAMQMHRRLQHYTFDTLEGRFAKAVLFVPVIILLGRSLGLYAEIEVMALMIATTIYTVIRQGVHAEWANTNDVKRWVYGVLQFVSVLAAILAAFSFGFVLDGIKGLSDDVILAMSFMVLLGLSHDMLLRWRSVFAKNALAIFCYTAALWVYGFVINSWSNPHYLTIGFVISLVCLMQSYICRLKAAFVVALGFVGLMLYQLAINIYSLIELSNWVTVGLIGAAIVIGVSILERYGARIQSAIHQRIK